MRIHEGPFKNQLEVDLWNEEQNEKRRQAAKRKPTFRTAKSNAKLSDFDNEKE